MYSRFNVRALVACLLLTLAPHALGANNAPQRSSSVTPPHVTSTAPITPTSSPASSTSATGTASATSVGGGSSASTTEPDVLLLVPELHVGRIELDVDNLEANINLKADVASLVQINAGVAVSIQKINLTISEVDAELELIVRLGHLVDIVNRVFQSLDLNPLLINTLNGVTSAVGSVLGDVVGAVDGLLGSITQGGQTLNFLVDNLGNIVQEVSGGASSIVGNYLTNMTLTGTAQSVGNGLTQNTYSYSPLNALVNVVTNTAGQVVQATVAKATGGSGSGSGSSGSTSKVSSPTSSSVAAASTGAHAHKHKH